MKLSLRTLLSFRKVAARWGDISLHSNWLIQIIEQHQPCDYGFLNEKPVLNVVRKGAIAIHYVQSDDVFNVGDVVQQKVDWDRRFDHMQQHSGLSKFGQFTIPLTKYENRRSTFNYRCIRTRICLQHNDMEFRIGYVFRWIGYQQYYSRSTAESWTKYQQIYCRADECVGSACEWRWKGNTTRGKSLLYSVRLNKKKFPSNR